LLGTLMDMQERLWRRASLSIGAPFGEIGGGLIYRGFERWMKWALWMKRLSLKRLRGGGLRLELLHWGPWKICYESLRIRTSLSMGAPFHLRGPGMWWGGSYTGNFDR